MVYKSVEIGVSISTTWCNIRQGASLILHSELFRELLHSSVGLSIDKD